LGKNSGYLGYFWEFGILIPGYSLCYNGDIERQIAYLLNRGIDTC
jgi:hypothetical protein